MVYSSERFLSISEPYLSDHRLSFDEFLQSVSYCFKLCFLSLFKVLIVVLIQTVDAELVSGAY